MRDLTPLFISLAMLFPINLHAQGFQLYSQEVSYLKMMLDCPKEKVLSPMKGFGSLYICTFGKSNSIKLFISERPNTDKVLNIGLLWNDWKTNIGYEIHSDLIEVERTLNFIVDMYVPARRDEINQAFWDSKNVDLSTSEFFVYFTHKEGLQKDERLIVIEEK